MQTQAVSHFIGGRLSISGGFLRLLGRVAITPATRIAVIAAAIIFCAAPAVGQIAPQPKPADYSSEPFVVEQIHSTLTFQNDGTSKSETTVRVKVQSDAAVKAWGTISGPYPSATSTLDFDYVRVIKPDQRVIETP